MVPLIALAALALGANLQLMGGAAAQQMFPTRTVHFILPFGPGSASDTTARLFADRLSARWGKPVVVENRPGGDGLVSLDAFVGAHDDHTMWFGPAGTFNVLPYRHDTLPFDPKRDLNPIASVSEVVLAVSTPLSMNVNSIDELAPMASRTSRSDLPIRSLAAANPPRSGTVSRSQTMTLGFMPTIPSLWISNHAARLS